MQNSIEMTNFDDIEFHVCRVVLGGHRDPVEVVRGLSILVQAGGAVHCTSALYIRPFLRNKISMHMSKSY